MRNIHLAVAGVVMAILFCLFQCTTEEKKDPDLADYQHPRTIAWTDQQEIIVHRLWK